MANQFRNTYMRHQKTPISSGILFTSADSRKIQITMINTMWPRQNGRHFPDDIFKCIFVNKNFCNLIKNSLTFVPKGPTDIHPAFGLNNGLVPNRWQAIIWTSVNQIHWRIYAAIWEIHLRVAWTLSASKIAISKTYNPCIQIDRINILLNNQIRLHWCHLTIRSSTRI